MVFTPLVEEAGKAIKAVIAPPTPSTDDLPSAAAPLPPEAAPPERDDPKIAAAAAAERADQLRKRGRRATILSGGRGVVGSAPLGRPTATAGAATLGG